LREETAKKKALRKIDVAGFKRLEMRQFYTATFKFLAFCGAVLANFTAAVTFLLLFGWQPKSK
jgi:hypothetical protein